MQRGELACGAGRHQRLATSRSLRVKTGDGQRLGGSDGAAGPYEMAGAGRHDSPLGRWQSRARNDG